MGNLDVGDTAPAALLAAPVTDERGQSKPLADHLGAGPAVLLFVRHFGCVGCDMHVTELAQQLWTLHDLGASTVILGNGPATFLQAFGERHGLTEMPVVLVTDPERATYAAAGLSRSLAGALGARALAAQVRAYGNGYRQGPVRGDLGQQGGALVLDRERRVRLAHHSERATDNVPVGALVQAVVDASQDRLAARGLV